MARNPRRISFESATDMARHLNGWSATSLTAPEQWADALVASRQWLDYSARNQVLLASYGVDGPVAGQETWRLVPSTTDERPCAVRAGEHGWPVRVPITTGGSEPDPYLGGTRPSRARTERFEWRPVFAVDQLARRPAPGALVPAEVPERLTGRRADEQYLAAVRKVARTTVRGRLPASTDAHQTLAEAAVRLSRGAKTPPLEPMLSDQVAWLVADRVGRATGELPAFDPEALEPRDRWQRLQAVLDPARKLTAALGVVVGTDLTASPLPKMEVVDDRVVPAGRRRRLPAASFERLPVGTWVEVGPYSPDEWAARGESGSGRGAYLRLNRSAYVVAVENGTEAAWRLEDVAERTGHDLLAAGDAPSLDQAKGDAAAALAGRYPALDTPTTALPTGPGRADPAGRPQAPAGWEPAAGEGNSAAVQRRLDDRVVVYAFPGPGGRWLPAVHNGTQLTRLAYAPNQDAAKGAAELAGRRALRDLANQSPVNRDATIAAFAQSEDYTRAELVDLAGFTLRSEAREQLADPNATPDTIIEVLRSPAPPSTSNPAKSPTCSTTPEHPCQSSTAPTPPTPTPSSPTSPTPNQPPVSTATPCSPCSPNPTRSTPSPRCPTPPHDPRPRQHRQPARSRPSRVGHRHPRRPLGRPRRDRNPPRTWHAPPRPRPAVDHLARGLRHDFTVWDALEEALRWWLTEQTALTTAAIDDDSTLPADDPLHTRLDQLLNRVGPDPSATAADALQQAIRHWVTTTADRYNAAHHWPHPAPRRGFPPPATSP